MRFFRLDFVALLCVALLCTVAALAQSNRGIITGTISDPTGAVVVSAAITARNTQTGATYETTTTATGNYTLPELPAGVYEVTIASAGFSKYIQRGITVQVAETARLDVVLQLGSASESVTVTADASLLKTDTSEVSHNITMENVSELPIMSMEIGGAGQGGIRNPYASIGTMPGATLDHTGAASIRVNGLPNNTYSARVEGQEATFSQQPNYVGTIQPAVDAMQEVTLQTSSFAPEYGQMAGGMINFTSKSGTNQLHGSAFEYWKNEDLNAGQPFSNSGNGHLVRPTTRNNNYGGSVGGPVYIPRLYNGRDKTFFFFNYDSSPSHAVTSGTYITVPTLAMRNGDFSQILTGRVLGTDSLGSNIMENTIYDPLTSRTVNGVVVTDPFEGNIIPKSRFDPVAAKIQALFPLPTNAGLVNNWSPVAVTSGTGYIATFKADEYISAKSKVSFYLSDHVANGLGGDGAPIPLTPVRDSGFNSPTIRLNFDRTVTPTLLVHVGIGFIRSLMMDMAKKGVLQYDAPGQLGLVGGVVNDFSGGTPATGFPRINGLNTSYGGWNQTTNIQLGGAGGSGGSIGPANANYYYLEKPTGVVSASLVRSNHTYKAGAEWRKDAHTDRNIRGTQGVYNFSNAETALPSTNGQNLGGGAVGFPYASFLLGAVDSASVNTPQDPQFRKTFWAMYVQDTWKVTRRLTLDYGLRWDYETALTELWNRLAAFSPTTPNPSAGGLLGGMAYAGTGPGRIGGQFTKNYPYAISPRLGVAWQITPKTVLRGGWGFTYSQTGGYNYISNTPIVGVGYNQLQWTTSSYGQPALTLQNGLQYTHQQLYAVSLNPGILPAPGQIQSTTYWLDPQGGRPGRINQWSIGLQREISKDLAVEATYVGNRGVWLQATGMNNLDAVTPQRISAAGLNINNAADQTLLNSRLNSLLAASRGFSTPPYAGFPLSATVAQSLRPFPQFSSIPVFWSPLGNSWYDALQAKVTKRSSHGLTVSGAFTWEDEMQLGTAGPINDVHNRPVQKNIGPSSLPFVFVTAFNYLTPKAGPNRWIRGATGDWSIGMVLHYQSGLPIQTPAANNALSSLLFQSTDENRVPGVPLFTQNLNCHCFNPATTFVLNPKAWTNPAAGQWGTAAAYYNDYRYQRRPAEGLSLARFFRIREGMRLEIQALFQNVFNRTYPNNPDSTNAQATQVVNATGQVVSGFGRIDTGSTWAGPRTGVLQARFEF